MQVLGVVTDTDRRGAQVFGTQLSARLAEIGLETRMVALAPGKTGGLEIDVLGVRPRDVRTLRALRRAMAGADVTIAHGSTTLSACAGAGVGAGRPFVYRQISDPAFWTPSFVKRVRTAIYHRFPTRVVALSARSAGVLARRFRISSHRITVIPNGADERHFVVAADADRAAARHKLGLPEGVPVVGYVGALHREKGLDDLLDATDPGWRIVLAGEGPHRAVIAGEAAKRGMNVDLLGTVEDPRLVYAASDVIVLPSWTEQQPAVLIEAAMTGTPCVATAVGDVPSIVVDGVTGGLVPPHRPADLRLALASLLADRNLRAAMGVAARDHVLSGFSLSAVGLQWADLLRSLAS